jgi:hypothetical protein
LLYLYITIVVPLYCGNSLNEVFRERKIGKFGKNKVLFSVGFLYELKAITQDSNDGYA